MASISTAAVVSTLLCSGLKPLLISNYVQVRVWGRQDRDRPRQTDARGLDAQNGWFVRISDGESVFNTSGITSNWTSSRSANGLPERAVDLQIVFNLIPSSRSFNPFYSIPNLVFDRGPRTSPATALTCRREPMPSPSALRRQAAESHYPLPNFCSFVTSTADISP